ncbi:LuxR C-terminal-related transcriptional regulator [Spirosoma telluris]
MIVLDMSQRLQQNLLTHFLKNRGFSIREREPDSLTEWTSITLLTDKPSQEITTSYGDQIWLLDKHGAMPLQVPLQVKGLLLSDCDLQELEICIRQVLAQQSYLSPGLMSLLNKQSYQATTDHLASLTSRERQVFELIKTGSSLRSIADALFISVHTAENHRANIQKKLGLTGHLSLVRYAANIVTAKK